MHANAALHSNYRRVQNKMTNFRSETNTLNASKAANENHLRRPVLYAIVAQANPNLRETKLDTNKSPTVQPSVVVVWCKAEAAMHQRRKTIRHISSLSALEMFV